MEKKKLGRPRVFTEAEQKAKEKAYKKEHYIKNKQKYLDNSEAKRSENPEYMKSYIKRC